MEKLKMTPAQFGNNLALSFQKSNIVPLINEYIKTVEENDKSWEFITANWKFNLGIEKDKKNILKEWIVFEMFLLGQQILKYFKGKVERDGIEWENTIDFYVRYLDREVVSYLTRLGNYLESTGKMNKIILANKYPILLVNANDIYQAILEKLEKDPYYLLKHPPNKLEV